MKLAVSDYASEYSGVGVLQRELYSRLEGLGIELVFVQGRDVSGGRIKRYTSLVTSALRRVPKDVDHFLATTTPIPLRVPVPATTFLYDLRWRRTRSAIARVYRTLDLDHAIRASRELVAISGRTAAELGEFRPNTPVVVAHLGPGQVEPGPITPHANRDVLLIGRAGHKRNLLAAEMLLSLPPGWFDSVIGVNLDPAVTRLLESRLPANRREWHSNISSSELGGLFRRSHFSVQLSVEEGFGLPYIEALAAGCVVVAIDQDLTREILGDSAILLKDGTADELSAQLQVASEPAVEARIAAASKYSWDAFAQQILGIVSRAN